MRRRDIDNITNETGNGSSGSISYKKPAIGEATTTVIIPTVSAMPYPKPEASIVIRDPV
jgi:hypothetical protein